MHRLLISIFCMFVIQTGAAEWNGENTIHCHLKEGEKFAVAEVFTHHYNYRHVYNFHNHDQAQKKSLKYLYPVYFKSENGKGKYTRVLTLISTANVEIKAENLNWNHSVTVKNRKVIEKSKDYDRLKKEWLEAFRRDLNKKAELYEDTELEYLLNLKHFHEPLKNSHKSWKNDNILEFLYSIAGLQDVRNAIPLKKNFTVADHQLTEKPPKSLTLPKVQVPENKADASNYPLSLNVPRSCYYMEFQNSRDLISALKFASNHFAQWSANTYPKSFESAIMDLIEDCGVDIEKLISSPDKYGKIAIAGWDPFYQTGTSLLVVIEKGGMKGGKEFYTQDSRSIFSNSKKLISMSEKAFEKERSLFHDRAFIHSRLKITPNKNEKFFIYLSDYWLTNFLSARWQILNGRLAEVDARIKLTEILRVSDRAEDNLSKAPTVKELRTKYSDHKELTWLLRDLKIEKGRVVHSEYGGLYNHPAIDGMAFDKVSKHEKKVYENFIRSYSANWREMDPLAFQINQEKDHIHTRLYISPISRLSDFREIGQVVLKNKEKHSLHEVPDAAFGLSFKFQTTLFQPFSSIKFPQRLQVSARAMDMAPRVESLKYIHKEDRYQDDWSYTRMPVMLEVPTLIANAVLPLIQGQTGPSEYEGLSVLSGSQISGNWLYNIFLSSDKEGYSRLGVNPNPLMQMTKNLGKKFETDIPSDLYFYADFSKGYSMHRYLMIMLARNRIYATWRRKSRMNRIRQMFGLEIDKSVFPQPDNNFNGHVPEPEMDEGWNGYPSSYVKNLPEILKALKKLELFVSVEDNAVSFDTKLKFKDFPQAVQRRQPAVVRPAEAEEPQLDFDDE